MDEHTMSNSLTVPKVLFCMVNYFESNLKHIQVEGLFRRNGSESTMSKLLTHLSFLNYRAMMDYTSNPHDVANLFKNILRDIAEPVVPFNFYETFMNINLKEYPSRDKRLQMIQNVLNPDNGTMPQINRYTLCYIVRFMIEITKH
jgi:hypothetical protein